MNLDLALAALLLLPGTATAPVDLIDATPTEVAVAAPAPGHSAQWDIEVVNLTDQELPLYVRITGEGAVLGGATPLNVSVSDAASGNVVVHPLVPGTEGEPVELPRLGAGEDHDLVGTVSLPAAAGNAYQGATGTIHFEFVTSIEEDTTPPDLVEADLPVQTGPAAPAPQKPGPNYLVSTGRDVVGALSIFAAAGVLLAAALSLVMRRRSNQ